MLYEVALRVVEFLPVLQVLSEVDLLCCPEGSLLVLVHLPHVVIANREEYKPVRVLL